MTEKYGVLPKFAHNMVGKDPNKVYYSGPYFDNSEISAAIETLLFGKWSSSGEVCARFEREFGKHINTKYSFFTTAVQVPTCCSLQPVRSISNGKMGMK